MFGRSAVSVAVTSCSRFPSRRWLSSSALAALALLSACAKAPEPAPGNTVALDQPTLDAFASGAAVEWRLLHNLPDDKCAADFGGGACHAVQISITPTVALPAQGWAIYFHTLTPVQSDEHPGLDVEHVNGDLHRLLPNAAFTGWPAGHTQKVVMRLGYWSLSVSDALPNYYLAAEGLQARVLAATQPQTDAETGLEVLSFVSGYDQPDALRKAPDSDLLVVDAALRYQRNAERNAGGDSLNSIDIRHRLIPTPENVTPRKAAPVSLAGGLSVAGNDFSEAQLQAAFARLELLGVARREGGLPLQIRKQTSALRDREGYTLDISDKGIRIDAADAAGAAYALQSIAGLLTPGKPELPSLRIEDAPRYPWRGLHLDVARNFHSKALVLKVLDQMAAYKLNTLHFHLADDEGWRVEIPGLEELTSVASKRCHDRSETQCLQPSLGSGPDAAVGVNGYYSLADYKEIVRYAAARHITVVPSFDMPGHARAAVRAMRVRHDRLLAAGKPDEARQYLLDELADTTRYSSIQYYKDNTINACLPSAYAFFDKVITELKQLHVDAGQPLQQFHIGADETPGAWLESPACKQMLAADNAPIRDPKLIGPYFIEQVAGILARHGLTVAGWSDGLDHARPQHMPPKVIANAWGTLADGGHKIAHRLANRGWQLVVSVPDVTYLDFPYDADPQERGLYWGARGIDTHKVFSFMPDNLPANARRWRDRNEQPYVADDRVEKDASGAVIHAPLRKDVQFHGLQAQAWSELVRSEAQVEQLLFPRLLAIAERAWHRASWETPYDHAGAEYRLGADARDAALQADWQAFATVLGGRELAKLDVAGIRYRVSTPGALLRDGQLLINNEFPDLSLEYRLDGQAWQSWREPVAVGAARSVEVRARSADGRRAGRSQLLNAVSPEGAAAAARPASPAN